MKFLKRGTFVNSEQELPNKLPHPVRVFVERWLVSLLTTNIAVFSTPLEGFKHDLDLSVTGAFVAAREAYKLWEASREAGSTKKRQFIFTGNCLSSYFVPSATFVTLGIHKNATTYWVGLADKLYKDKGFR